MKKGKRHGKGEYFYNNGSIYKGEFLEDEKHGFGKLIING